MNETEAVHAGTGAQPAAAQPAAPVLPPAAPRQQRRRGLAAPLALPAGFAALLVVGAAAAATHGGLSAGWVLGLAAAIVLAGAAVSEPSVAPVLAAVGWLTVIGFSRAPYAQLRLTGTHALTAALVLAGCTLAGLAGGLVLRRLASSYTLFVVEVSGERQLVAEVSGERQPGTDPIEATPGASAAPCPSAVAAADPASPASLASPVPLVPPASPVPLVPPASPASRVPPASVDEADRPDREIPDLSPAPSRKPAPSPAPSASLTSTASLGPAPSLSLTPAPSRISSASLTPTSDRGLLARLSLMNRLSRMPDLTGGIGRRRLLSGVLLVGGLPLLTLVLSLGGIGQHHLGDDLLVYLVAVVAVAVVGGFWPAVLAAITASLLVNWYFTPPVHTLTIGDGQSLVALLLFVTVAVTVSSVVHLAALRARQAARSTGEAQELLALAQTVLGGSDAPAAVLAHLTRGHGGRAELLERAGGQWIRVAVSGDVEAAAGAGPDLRAEARADLTLVATGQTRPLTGRLLDGFAAQAAAALDRDRLRTQAARAEALAEGNRMRTALLAAVSHDLRTPLASIKASVSTLRQTDVAWTPADEAALLATIERSSDRLDALIGNLLDMSRLTAGSLQPFLRPTAIDEVAPVALRGLDAGTRMQLMVPDDLPLVRTDPGLLERVLANLFANALAYSPAQRDPELRAGHDGEGVLLEVVDHGPGVPDELKEQMFEAFRRLDNRGGPAAPGGIGLGLAVVQGFLGIMGGSVQPVDTPGGGLTMRVRLPASAETARATALAAQQ